jgi:DNA-binding response OmpR family regulator
VPNVWVIEDDASIRQGLVRALSGDGLIVESAADVAAIATLEGVPDLVLLDVNLPDGDGFDVCRSLASRFVGVRIMLLTARTEEIDIVIGLDSGAIDYVTKPFRLAELKARVRAQLRLGEASPDQLNRTGIVEIGDVRLDSAARRAWVAGQELTLRTKEFDLLERLMSEPGRVVRREDLMRDVWDEHWFGSTKTLDVHIASLRRRLGESSAKPSRISTIRGVGFRFEDTT